MLRKKLKNLKVANPPSRWLTLLQNNKWPKPIGHGRKQSIMVLHDERTFKNYLWQTPPPPSKMRTPFILGYSGAFCVWFKFSLKIRDFSFAIKWSATKWIRYQVIPLSNEGLSSDPLSSECLPLKLRNFFKIWEWVFTKDGSLTRWKFHGEILVKLSWNFHRPN